MKQLRFAMIPLILAVSVGSAAGQSRSDGAASQELHRSCCIT
jgi:hypothetical protein